MPLPPRSMASMASLASLASCLLLLLLVVLPGSLAAKLNVPRVLLPHSESAPSFVLESSDHLHCFKWTTSRPELVHVEPVKDAKGCSYSARVSSVAKGMTWSRIQAIVSAEDVQSPGHVLRCDVIIDSISRLSIVTKTHELYLEEPPEEFGVRAYDDHGNEFSTLEGITFKWTFENVVRKSSSSGRGDNVRFLSYRDSPYDLETKIQELEAAGKQGNKILIEGIKTGSSKVSVKLTETSYVKVPPADVNVIVRTNLYLIPDLAYVMLGGLVAYSAEQIKANELQAISLPSPQYFLEITSESVAQLSSPGSAQAVGAGLGNCEIHLRDHNVSPEDSVKPPTADLYVVEPASIELRISSGSWLTIRGQHYTITVDVFDTENRRIYSSSNLAIEVEFDTAYFNTIESTANGTYHFGSPVKIGSTEVRARLLGVYDSKGELRPLKTQLTTSETMDIFEEIVLSPQIAAFPFDPATSSSYELNYTVAGGSKPFFWSSSATSVATLAQSGTAKTAMSPKATVGIAQVTAAMSKAMHNKGEARIALLPAGLLSILPDRQEVEIGNNLAVPVALYSPRGNKHSLGKAFDAIPFHQCHHVALQTKVSDEKVFDKPTGNTGLFLAQQEKSSAPDACTYLDLKAVAPGVTNVRVTYTFPNVPGQSTAKPLTSETTLAAYRPLTPVQPTTGTVLLAVDSSIHVAWTGGPAPWVKKPEGFFSQIKVSDEAIVRTDAKLASKSSAGLYAFPVTCLTQGTTEVTLSVGNKPSETLKNPVVVTSTVKVKCAYPDALELSAEIPGPAPGTTSQPCPLTARAGRVAALAYEELKIRVVVVDKAGHPFDSFNSVKLEWDVSNAALGKVKVPTGVANVQGRDNMDYKPSTPAYQIFIPKGKTGFVDISAKLENSGGGFISLNSISATVPINLVDDAVIEPATLSIFNHPSNREFFKILGGSGYFEVSNSHSQVADTRFISSNSTVRVAPLQDGDANLVVTDICLKTKKPAQARAHVSGIHTVELLASERIQRGSSGSAIVRLLDRHGQDMSAVVLSFVQIDVQPASGIVKVMQKDDSKPLTYVVKGFELGDTTMVATARFGVQQVSSSPQSVQVFPPLEVEPRNVTLIIGARFQVRTIGGPRPDANIEYSIAAKSIAKVSGSGLIEASLLGSTKLTARAVGIDKATGKTLVLSEDTIDVHVVKLTGINIHTPITRMVVGSEMPVTAMGTDEHQNPYSFGSALPYLELTWSVVSNPDTAALLSPFHKSGLDVSVAVRNAGTLRLRALQPGRMLIKLQARISQTLPNPGQFQLEGDRELVDIIEIVVFEDLRVTNPLLDGSSNLVLLSPGASYQLATNRDNAVAEMKYTVMSPEVDAPVSVSHTGELIAHSKASSRRGSACIVLIEAVEDSGVVQRTSVVVEVRPVVYMMLNAEGGFSASRRQNIHPTLPKGFKVELNVSYHDGVGRRFDGVSEYVDIRPSRFDTLLLKDQAKNRFSTELLREEYTVLRAFTKGEEKLQDFLVLHTRRAILPDIKRHQVLTGDVVDFDSLVEAPKYLTSKSKHRGTWSAEPEQMWQMNPQTGVAMALRSGPSRITYAISDLSKTSVDVEVKPAKGIIVSTDVSLSRVPGPQHVPFSVSGSAAGVNDTASNFFGERNIEAFEVVQGAIFSCSARFSDATESTLLSELFDVSAVFTTRNNLFSHSCQFTPKESLFHMRSALISSDIVLKVHGTFNSETISSAEVPIAFIPGFHVITEDITLSNVEPKDIIQIQGLASSLNSLRIEVSNDQLLEIGRDYSDAASSMRYVPVYLRSAYWTARDDRQSEPLTVTLFSTLSPQRLHIPVRVVLAGGADGCPQPGELSWLSFFAFIFSHYQYLGFLVFCCSLVYVVALRVKANKANNGGGSKKLIGGPPPSQHSPLAGSPKQSPLLSSSPTNWISSPRDNLTNANRTPYLFTADKSPIYGSPEMGSMHRRSPRSLTQYSYSEQ